MAFKVVHLHPVEPILIWNFSTFLLWYLGLIAYCIQTWPSAACWVNFVLNCFKLLNLILEVHCLLHSNLTICSLLSQFSSEIFHLFILILGSPCLWHSNLTICSMLSLFSGNQSFGSCTSIPSLNFLPAAEQSGLWSLLLLLLAWTLSKCLIRYSLCWVPDQVISLSAKCLIRYSLYRVPDQVQATSPPCTPVFPSFASWPSKR